MKKRSYSKRNPNYMQSLDGSGPRKFIKVKSTNDYVDIHDPSGRMLDGYIRFVDGLQGGLYSVYLASEEVNDLGEPLEYYKTNESEYIPPSPFYVEPNPQKGTNKQKTRDALRMLRAALAEATDTESGRQPSKRHADFVMRLKAGIEELEKELKGSKRNPRYLVSRDGNELGIFPGFNALMAINAARKIYGPGKYSSTKTGEAMYLGRGALETERREREERTARAAAKAAAKRDKIQLPKKSRTRRNAEYNSEELDKRFEKLNLYAQSLNVPAERSLIEKFTWLLKDLVEYGMRYYPNARTNQRLLASNTVTTLNTLGEETTTVETERAIAILGRAVQIILTDEGIRGVKKGYAKPPVNLTRHEFLRWRKLKQNPRTRRNPAEKDAEHPIEVTRHFRGGPPGYLSPWQKAMAIGQQELFDTGIKLHPRVAELRAARFSNPGATKPVYQSGLKQATAGQLPRLARVGLRVGRTPAEIRSDLATTGRFSAEQIRRAIDQATTAERRSNPPVRQIFETFNGRPATKTTSVQAPRRTPARVAQLGRLRLIRTADGRTWRFPGDRAPFLAADSRGKLHVVGGQYRANPAGEICGEIEQIEYQTSKPHLGHDNETIYYHQLGEETGERPILEITPEGELQIRGGDYRIEADGIHN